MLVKMQVTPKERADILAAREATKYWEAHGRGVHEAVNILRAAAQTLEERKRFDAIAQEIVRVLVKP